MLVRHENIRPDIAVDLRRAVITRSTLEASHASQNVGGWRSREDLFDWRSPCAAELEAAILALPEVRELYLQGCTLHGWAIVNRDGSFHRRHHHDRYQTVLSGIWYADNEGSVTVIEQVAGGLLCEEHVTPMRGLVVTFPPTWWHRVEPHTLPEPRVTVAFDVRRAPRVMLPRDRAR